LPGGGAAGASTSGGGAAGGGESEYSSDYSESEGERSSEGERREEERQRQQQRPDDDKAPKFRRQGLPSRALVDRVGDLYTHVHVVGGQSAVLADVALVLQERRRCIARNTRASTPGGRQRVFKHAAWVVLSRALQQEVWEILFQQWCEDLGRPYLEKIRSSGRCATQEQVVRALRGFYKTHCFYIYGGELWLRFMIAVGRVSRHAVDAANDVVHTRVQYKRHEWGTKEARPADSHHFLRREARASTPGGATASAEQAGSASASAQEAGRTSASTTGEARASTSGEEKVDIHPRAQRRAAKKERKRLHQERARARDQWTVADIDRRLEEVQQKLDAADAASWDHGFPFVDQHGRWQQVNPQAPESFFEEALSRMLVEVGFTRREVDIITEREDEEEERRGEARASTPGWAPQWMRDLPGKGSGRGKGGAGRGGGGGGYGRGGRGGGSWYGGGWYGGSAGSWQGGPYGGR